MTVTVRPTREDHQPFSALWKFEQGQVSHPFVERLIGTIRREFLDHVLIWNAVDLGRKLEELRNYYNEHRVHQSLSGRTPGEMSGKPPPVRAVLTHYAWRHHCRGLLLASHSHGFQRGSAMTSGVMMGCRVKAAKPHASDCPLIAKPSTH